MFCELTIACPPSPHPPLPYFIRLGFQQRGSPPAACGTGGADAPGRRPGAAAHPLKVGGSGTPLQGGGHRHTLARCGTLGWARQAVLGWLANPCFVLFCFLFHTPFFSLVHAPLHCTPCTRSLCQARLVPASHLH